MAVNREENLREACCIGDFDAVSGMLANGIDVNSQNSMNGWTALHWAVHRGHSRVVSLLLASGAKTSIASKTGQTAVDLAKHDGVRGLLGLDPTPAPEAESGGDRKEDFQPNYLKHPQMAYVQPSKEATQQQQPTPTRGTSAQELEARQVPGNGSHAKDSATAPQSNAGHLDPEPSASTGQAFVVKARLAESSEEDFVEVDIPDHTFDNLLQACAEELEVDAALVAKVRRLPNVLVRKDRDVQRLAEGCELELVMKK